MKTLITLLFLFLTSNVIGEEKVYYCKEDASTGFQSSENYKKTDFLEEKFTAKIDFENLFFSSPDIFMTHTICTYTILHEHLMQCFTNYGAIITINRINLKFASANVLGIGTDGDSLLLGHGSCSVF